MATLKNLVDETTNIKNELATCHTNLKNNLISKGVECSDADKMSSLIDKVNEFPSFPVYIAGDTNCIFNLEAISRTTLTYKKGILYNLHAWFSGSIRFNFSSFANANTNNSNAGMNIKHYRKGSLIKEHKINYPTNGAQMSYIYDLTDIKPLDNIIVENRENFNVGTSNIKISYD